MVSRVVTLGWQRPPRRFFAGDFRILYNPLKPHFPLGRLIVRWLLFLVPAVLFVHPANAQQPNSLVEGATEQKLNQTLRDYAAAINARDWERLPEFLHEDVEYRDDSLELVAEGRDALTKQIREALTETPLKLDATIESIDLVDQTSAVIKGTNSLGTEIDSGETFAFTVRMAEDSGVWKIKSIYEQSLSSDDAVEPPLQSLSWMVGVWQDQGERKLTSSIRFLPGEQFLVRTFSRDGESEGFQVIGFDPIGGGIQSSSYFVDGSFGSATWSKRDDRWLVKSVQTLADGRIASGTYVITPKEEVSREINSMTVKVVGHEVAGQPVPSVPEMVIARVSDQSVSQPPAAESDQ